MLIFTKWYCRLGNNIIQLQHAIQLCLFLKCKIKFTCRKHKYFNLDTITEYFEHHDNIEREIKTPSSFYYKNEIEGQGVSIDIFNKYIHESCDLLKKAFIIKPIINTIKHNDIVVHVRSGDIFKNTPHSTYTPPPLSYYTRIINSGTYDKIRIVCEDNKNPIVDKLLEMYPNSEHKIQSLDEDIKIILGATNLVNSVGTFIPGLSAISNHCVNIYTTETYQKELEKYYKVNHPWKNSDSQRKLLLNYTFPEIIETSNVHEKIITGKSIIMRPFWYVKPYDRDRQVTVCIIKNIK